MDNEINHLRQFGKFRLDSEKRVLWHESEPVNLPLKGIELLCVLTEKGGEVYTKEELMDRVWADSFVEESNLSRHIYQIRKTFKEYGESEDLIQTVPRRGYRFTAEVRESENGGEILERHSLTQTLIEIHDEESDEPTTYTYFTAHFRDHTPVLSHQDFGRLDDFGGCSWVLCLQAKRTTKLFNTINQINRRFAGQIIFGYCGKR